MINKIKLNDFQSHSDTEIDFSDKVNVIIGKSDSGKTAIIRALDHVINNNPSGDAFISHGKKQSKVEITVNDIVIQRLKGKENCYYLGDKELKGFGSKAPDQIQDFFNFTDLNLQSQFDKSFLVSESAGYVSRYLNKIINLDIIDTSLSNIEKMYRSDNRKLNIYKDNKTQLLSDIDSYTGIEKIGNRINRIAEKLQIIEKENDKVCLISNIISNCNSENDKLFHYESLDRDLKFVMQYFENVSDNEKELEKIDNLSNIVKRAKKANTDLNKYKNIEKELKSLYDVMESQSDLEKSKAELENNKNTVSLVKSLNNNLDSCKKKIQDYETELKDKMPDVCPLCGNFVEK